MCNIKLSLSWRPQNKQNPGRWLNTKWLLSYPVWKQRKTRKIISLSCRNSTFCCSLVPPPFPSTCQSSPPCHWHRDSTKQSFLMHPRQQEMVMSWTLSCLPIHPLCCASTCATCVAFTPSLASPATCVYWGSASLFHLHHFVPSGLFQSYLF